MSRTASTRPNTKQNRKTAKIQQDTRSVQNKRVSKMFKKGRLKAIVRRISKPQVPTNSNQKGVAYQPDRKLSKGNILVANTATVTGKLLLKRRKSAATIKDQKRKLSKLTLKTDGVTSSDLPEQLTELPWLGPHCSLVRVDAPRDSKPSISNGFDHVFGEAESSWVRRVKVHQDIVEIYSDAQVVERYVITIEAANSFCIKLKDVISSHSSIGSFISAWKRSNNHTNNDPNDELRSDTDKSALLHAPQDGNEPSSPVMLVQDIDLHQ